MSKKLTIITFIFFASAAVSLYAADVAGDQEMTSQGRRGSQTQTFTIAQNGEKITVTMEGRGEREWTAKKKQRIGNKSRYHTFF